MEQVSREHMSQEQRQTVNRINRILGRGLAVFIALYIAATICFIILV